MTGERDDAMHDFLAGSGWNSAALEPLPGDASTRRYLRVAQGGRSAMLMDQPQGAEAPASPSDATAPERHALGYNAVARLAGADCGRFVAVAEYLRRRGLSTPEIFADDVVRGFVLMEDFGDNLYTDVLARGGDETLLYRAAVDALARLHAEAAPAALAPDKSLYAYDEIALLAEIDLMTEWFLPMARGRAAQPEEVDAHRALWRQALNALPAASQVFVHRDYHAQNLLWLPQRHGPARAGLIDFQDAVAGARSYDLVSLIEDARRDVAPDLREAMTRRYLDAMAGQDMPHDEEAYRAEMAVMAAQRNAKIVGIFARLFKRDGKPRYLAYLPRVWGHLNRDLEHPALASLKAWYERAIPRELRGRIEGVTP
jgi:aminoglycoside/choline kinase family phosphotransferase